LGGLPHALARQYPNGDRELLSCPQVLGPDGMLVNHRGARHGTEERVVRGEAG
jgi:hypothetical protein